MKPTDVLGQLRSQWTRTKLGESESFKVIFFRYPFPLLYEISLHVGDERDRTTKSHSAETKKVQQQASRGARQRDLL
jgi:hypothetical protein